MIKGTVTGDEAARRALSQGADNLPRRMSDTITKLTLKLTRRVKEQKLSGQVLNARTGRLRRSVGLHRRAGAQRLLLQHVRVLRDHGRKYTAGLSAPFRRAFACFSRFIWQKGMCYVN
jgi:hypothetical protein